MSSRFDSAPPEASALLTALFSFIRSAHCPEKRIPPYSYFVRRIRVIGRDYWRYQQIRSITKESLEFNGFILQARTHTLIFHWFHDNVNRISLWFFFFLPFFACSLFNSSVTSSISRIIMLSVQVVLSESRLHSPFSLHLRDFHVESSRHWRNTHSKITLGTFAITK